MNSDEAKTILLLYRPGTADAEDPQIAAALAVARGDAELSRWLEEHCARQRRLRDRFQAIAVPAGLKEQIISEHLARKRSTHFQRNFILAVAAIVALLGLAVFWRPARPGAAGSLALYQRQMAGIALRSYGMDLATSDATAVKTYFAEQHAPADYVVPAGLQKAQLVGCAVESWQGAKVAMICFRTGRPAAPGVQSDLWLFVVNRGAVKDAPVSATPQFAEISRLATAAWTRAGNLYLLGLVGDEQTIGGFL